MEILFIAKTNEVAVETNGCRILANPPKEFADAVANALQKSIDTVNKWLEENGFYDPEGFEPEEQELKKFDKALYGAYKEYKRNINSLPVEMKSLYGGYKSESEWMFLVWRNSEVNGEAGDFGNSFVGWLEDEIEDEDTQCNIDAGFLIDLTAEFGGLRSIYRNFGKRN